MTIRCKAAILRAAGAPAPYAKSKPLSVEEVTLDPPQAGEVLIKIVGAGLCHSDLSVMNGTRVKWWKSVPAFAMSRSATMWCSSSRRHAGAAVTASKAGRRSASVPG
jgi:NADPH:quinone reductase-like Zn-dependent oxidoreductase